MMKSIHSWKFANFYNNIIRIIPLLYKNDIYDILVLPMFVFFLTIYTTKHFGCPVLLPLLRDIS